MNGTDLLTQFRESGSEAAFGELVRRYTNLVYSAAYRRLASDALAQEATQMVFIRLARAAPMLPSDAALAAWLHRTTLHVSIDLWRSESRRAAREEQAAAMQPDGNESVLWNELTPMVDEALNHLNDVDRQTLLLRFFQQKTMRDLGATFGVSEDAAKMRVSRALERMRRQLTNRGVACSALVLGTLLAQRSVEAAPGPLCAALGSISWPAPATGLSGFLLRVSKVKLAGTVAGLILAGAVTLVLLQTERPAKLTAENPAITPNTTAPTFPAAVNTPDAEPSAGDQAVDPLKLLQAVARARNSISSGSMDFDLFRERIENGRKETNHLRLKAVFDGSKMWFDTVGREFRYPSVGAEGAAADQAKIDAQNLDREGAVRAGLLQGFEAHYVSAWDGTTFMQYRETDGRSSDAVISDPSDSSVYFFDPRCLGLRSSPYWRGTIEGCLSYGKTSSIKLLGMESIDGVAAWRVNIVNAGSPPVDFWIDAAHPVRVLRQVEGRDMVNSKYDDDAPDNPIPVEVNSIEYRNATTRTIKRYTRSRAELNRPVDPAHWTLAGLGMKVGAAVVDVRIQRRIGYWTGAGLSDDNPGTNTPTAPDRVAQMALLETNPGSDEALTAAVWILLNSPDGLDVEKAAEVIRLHHTASPNVATLAKELERMRHRSSQKLLEAILEQNPDREIRACACFTLATLLKAQAKFGRNKEATRDAEKYFEQVITEFGQAGSVGADLARRSKPELNELRHFTIGHQAPEITGRDLDGQPVKLSDYRGKVVVLFFWTASTASDAAENMRFLQQLPDRSFALVGINCDDDLAKAKEAAERYKLNWSSIHEGRRGSTMTAWNVNSWLSSFILDAKGVIRDRDLRGRDLTNAVAALSRE